MEVLNLNQVQNKAKLKKMAGVEPGKAEISIYRFNELILLALVEAKSLAGVAELNQKKELLF